MPGMFLGLLASIILFTALSQSASASTFSTGGPWRVPEVPLIIDGTVVAVEPAGERGLGVADARPGQLLFPHSVARIRVAAVLRDRDGGSAVPSDTITVWFATSDTGRRHDGSGRAVSVSSINVPEIHVGQTGAWFLRQLDGQWYFQAPSVPVAQAREGLSARGEAGGTFATAFDFDLDGDGQAEHIDFTTDRDDRGSACCAFQLTINGVPLRHRGIGLTGPAAVVDVDSTDGRFELAVSELGPSDDDATHFFGWADGRVMNLGTLPGRPGSWSPLVIDGSGVVATHCRGHILQTWFHPCRYKLSPDGALEPVAEASYQMGTPLVMLQDLAVHIAPDIESATLRLQAGERIVVVSSDDRQWCEVETANGRRGWFSVKNFDQLADGRRAGEVFEGLVIAD
jgi:hypothetical protein